MIDLAIIAVKKTRISYGILPLNKTLASFLLSSALALSSSVIVVIFSFFLNKIFYKVVKERE